MMQRSGHSPERGTRGTRWDALLRYAATRARARGTHAPDLAFRKKASRRVPCVPPGGGQKSHGTMRRHRAYPHAEIFFLRRRLFECGLPPSPSERPTEARHSAPPAGGPRRRVNGVRGRHARPFAVLVSLLPRGSAAGAANHYFSIGRRLNE
jgi:hypothetical protein